MANVARKKQAEMAGEDHNQQESTNVEGYICEKFLLNFKLQCYLSGNDENEAEETSQPRRRRAFSGKDAGPMRKRKFPNRS